MCKYFVTFEYLIQIKEYFVRKYLGYHHQLIMHESFSLKESYGNVLKNSIIIITFITSYSINNAIINAKYSLRLLNLFHSLTIWLKVIHGLR